MSSCFIKISSKIDNDNKKSRINDLKNELVEVFRSKKGRNSI